MAPGTTPSTRACLTRNRVIDRWIPMTMSRPTAASRNSPFSRRVLEIRYWGQNQRANGSVSGTTVTAVSESAGTGWGTGAPQFAQNLASPEMSAEQPGQMVMTEFRSELRFAQSLIEGTTPPGAALRGHLVSDGPDRHRRVSGADDDPHRATRSVIGGVSTVHPATVSRKQGAPGSLRKRCRHVRRRHGSCWGSHSRDPHPTASGIFSANCGRRQS